MVGLMVVEFVAVVGYCVWTAVARPEHAVGAVAAVVAAAVLWLFVAVQVVAVRRGLPGGSTEADEAIQRERLEAALAEVAPRAGLGDVRVVMSPGGADRIALRRPRGAWTLVATPGAIAARDDAALVGALALQVAWQRRSRARAAALLLTAWSLLAMVLPLVITWLLTGDGWIAFAVAVAASGVLLAAGMIVTASWLFSTRRTVVTDAEAARIAGSPEPVVRALQAADGGDEMLRRARREERGLLVWPAQVFMDALARRWSPRQRRRIDALRQTESPTA
jgi:hypothetical protein